MKLFNNSRGLRLTLSPLIHPLKPPLNPTPLSLSPYIYKYRQIKWPKKLTMKLSNNSRELNIYMYTYIHPSIHTYIHIHVKADKMAQEADDEIIQQQQRIKAIAESIERLTIASKEDIILQVIFVIF
jgi:hypothetical protein